MRVRSAITFATVAAMSVIVSVDDPVDLRCLFMSGEYKIVGLLTRLSHAPDNACPTENFLFLPRRSRAKAAYAVTNARFAALHGLPVAPSPLDDARSTPQTACSSRASIREVPHRRRASVCGSAAALRSGSVPAVSPLSASLLPLADHRQKPEKLSQAKFHCCHFEL